MGPVVAITTSKGGGGKTTLAMALACVYATAKRRFTVIDADRNGTFARWAKEYYEGPTFGVVVEISHTAIPKAIQDAATSGLVLVDTAGFENQTAAYAMGCADLVLIPCMPDRGSTWEASRTAANVDAMATMTGRDPITRIVLSKWNSRGLAERAALADLAAESLKSLESPMPPLADFAKLSFSGRMDFDSRSAQAAQSVADEIDKILRKNLKPRKAA